ncbi:hypothetical protein OROGR_008607 [Orobanche gracilis]
MGNGVPKTMSFAHLDKSFYSLTNQSQFVFWRTSLLFICLRVKLFATKRVFLRVYPRFLVSMDKFNRNRDGDRYSNSVGEPHQYNSSGRHSRGGGSSFPHHRQDNFRDGGVERNSPHNYRSGLTGGGVGRGSGGGGRENPRTFDSPPPSYHSPLGGDGGILGGGLGPTTGAVIGGFRPTVGGLVGGSGGRGFRPMGGLGGGFRPMESDGGVVDGFQWIGGGSNNGGEFQPIGVAGVDGGGFRQVGGAGGAMISAGGGFRPMGGDNSDGGRFGLDEYHEPPPPPLTGQKRGYPFPGRERSPGIL